MAFYTYMLLCSDGSYYVGKTNNVTKRLRQHNGEIKGGAKYTASKRPVVLRHLEEFSTHKESAQREVALKKLNHKQKEYLITTAKSA